MKRLGPALLLAFCLVLPGLADAAEGEAPPARSWPWQGVFGTYDRAQLQRGLEVYSGVCAACHGLKYVRFRNLEAIGLSEDDVRAFAAGYQVTGEPDEFGDPTVREALPSDAFPAPFPNEQAARAANGGSLPPDLSLIVKARAGGADYLHALLTGYASDEPDASGLYRNPYMSGGMIAMAPPLFDGMVGYADGTEATVSQMAQDVTAFLAWAAEPTLEDRKSLGLKVILFLLVLTGLFYVTKRKIWANVEH